MIANCKVLMGAGSAAALFGLLVLPRAFSVSPPPQNPHVIVVSPLGVAPGVATKITVRGLRLDSATQVRFQDAKASVKVLSKGKAPVPDKQEPTRVGDTQVEAEVTLPPSTPAGTVSFVVVNAAGESPPHRLLVDGAGGPVKEKEPNNGFAQAQPIRVPQTVEGAINPAQDVDVFRFEGKQGEHLVCEVLAARHGSALDSILTLSDAAGHELASNDDADGADSRLEVTLPAAGTYYLTVMDAHDQGGPAHVYRLSVRTK